MYILGISAFYHDSAACLLLDGEIIAAAQEERFSRIKHDASFPHNAILFCLQEAGIKSSNISNIVFYEKPFLKFERLLETYLAFAPKGLISFCKSMPAWIKNKLFLKNELIKNLNVTLGSTTDWKNKVLFSEHHLSHASSAFFPSPFKNAAILTLDGVGEWATTSLAIGKGNNIRIIKEIKFPHSLGLLYSAFTYYLGFKVNSSEYKVMGLAPYGRPKYKDIIREKLLNISEDGSFQINMSYFNYASGLTMTNKNFHKLFGAPPRKQNTEISQREMDLAASIQEVAESIVIQIAKNIANETGERNLCLAGGVALNCVINGKLQSEKIFDNIWVQPASGDAGGALGAAMSAWHLHFGKERNIKTKFDKMKGSYLGPGFKNDFVEAELKQNQARFKKYSEERMIDIVANAIAEGKAVGWMQGRMEYGPRALGGRSIIADPRSPTMQKQLNLKIKNRESFRPFAPSILREDVSEWFEQDIDSPYMLFVNELIDSKRLELDYNNENLFGFEKLNVLRSSVPAVTHVDYSARIQTVHKDTNKLFYKLISKFKQITGFPLLVNTSFNVRGEPIVCSPKDAINCFMSTELDLLVIGNFILQKEEQIKNNMKDYDRKFELD